MIDVYPGYAGGKTLNPTYEQVCSGTTGHAEVARIVFDPKMISVNELLELFWWIHDPTQLNRQGNDIGTQYRSAIYTTTPEHLELAMNSKLIYQAELTKNNLPQIVTEILSGKGVTYWLAEEYHQKYLAKNPNGYDCHSSTGVPYPRKVAQA